MIKNIVNNIIIKEYKFKYLIFSIISGILLALSFQKFNIFLLVWVAFIPLIYCIYKNNLKKSLIYGFITGVVYSVISFSWMFPFLLLYTKSLKATIIVSTTFWICSSSYFLVWSGLANIVKQNNKIIIALFMSAVWIILEYVRNILFGGFPINSLGYSQWSFIYIIQFSDIFGIYGISFIIILINILLFYWLYTQKRKYLIYSLAIILTLIFYGYTRINQISKIKYGNEISIGVVQPNIEQRKKWDDKKRQEVANILILCSQQFKDSKADIVLYPETVLPGRILLDEKTKNLVKNISQFSRLNLIGGKHFKNSRVYNSIFMVDNDGNIIDNYDKKHLVLFGERVPFKNFLSDLFKKNKFMDNFHKGTDLKIFDFNKYKLGISICSEIYYPYLYRELVLKGANLLTNHTNVAWCDGSFYPYQHFVLNVFRAIENRKYLIVSANTGISGVIAPTGKIIKQTENQERVCFEEKVYTNNYITTYDKIGDLFVYLCMIYVGIVLLYFLFIKKQMNKVHLFFKI